MSFFSGEGFGFGAFGDGNDSFGSATIQAGEDDGWQGVFDFWGDPLNLFGEAGDLLTGPQAAMQNYRDTIDSIINEQLALSNEQQAIYDENFLPYETQFVQEARGAGTADYEGAASRAGNYVEGAYDQQEGATDRRVRGLGLDPTSAAAQENRRLTGLQRGADVSGAKTRAMRAEKDRAESSGWAQQVQALSLGNNLPTEAAAGLTQAGSAQVGAIGAEANAEYAGFSHGGPVRGPGTETSDSIPARLSNGEFVMSAAAVRRFGLDRLEKMNNEALQKERGLPGKRAFKYGGAAVAVTGAIAKGLDTYNQMQAMRDRQTEAAERRKERDMRMKALQAQVKKAEQDAEYQAMVRDHEAALGPFLTSGDPTPLMEWSNKHWPGINAQIVRNEDGSYLAKTAKGEKRYANADELALQSVMMTNPLAYLEKKMKSEGKEEYYTDAGGNVHYLRGGKATPVMSGGKPVRGLPGGKDGGSQGATERMIDRISKEFRVEWPVAFEIYKTSASNPADMLRKNYLALADADQQNFVERSDEERMTEARRMTELMLKSNLGGVSHRYRGKSEEAPMPKTPTVRSAILGDPVDIGAGPAAGLAPPAQESDPAPAAAGEIPTVRSDADYQRLPPGTVFLDPQGNKRQKPRAYAEGGYVHDDNIAKRPGLNRLQKTNVQTGRPPSGGFNRELDRQFRDDKMSVQMGEMTQEQFEEKWGAGYANGGLVSALAAAGAGVSSALKRRQRKEPSTGGRPSANGGQEPVPYWQHDTPVPRVRSPEGIDEVHPQWIADNKAVEAGTMTRDQLKAKWPGYVTTY